MTLVASSTMADFEKFLITTMILTICPVATQHFSSITKIYCIVYQQYFILSLESCCFLFISTRIRFKFNIVILLSLLRVIRMFRINIYT
eukprot:UN02386